LCSFHVFKIAREFRSKAWIAPLSPPATRMRPSERMDPLRATSETPNRAIVLMTLRVRLLRIWIRGPEVTAKSSWGAESAATVLLIAGEGTVMLVIGLEDCDGESRSGEEKVSQYFCSLVRALGPAGSFAGCSR
jgi:hypothetical protein